MKAFWFHFALLEKEWKHFFSLCTSRKRVKVFCFHFSLLEHEKPTLAGSCCTNCMKCLLKNLNLLSPKSYGLFLRWITLSPAISAEVQMRDVTLSEHNFHFCHHRFSESLDKYIPRCSDLWQGKYRSCWEKPAENQEDIQLVKIDWEIFVVCWDGSTQEADMKQKSSSAENPLKLRFG